MAALCLFDVDGTLTAPRQVGGAREALGREAEPLQRPDRGDDRPGTGARVLSGVRRKRGPKKLFQQETFRVGKFGSEFLWGPGDW